MIKNGGFLFLLSTVTDITVWVCMLSLLCTMIIIAQLTFCVFDVCVRVNITSTCVIYKNMCLIEKRKIL